MRETRVPVRMGGLILALTLFGIVFFGAGMLITYGISVLISSLGPNGDWRNLYWLAVIIAVPTVVTGAVSGLTSAFGAFIGKRVSTTADGLTADRMKVSLGAGIGGALGSALFLIYMSWLYQAGPGLWILVLGFIVVFGAYAGITALWLGWGMRRELRRQVSR